MEVARQLERGIVDIEVLKQSQENLIKVLNEINEVRQEGKVKRIEATQQLRELQTEMTNNVLLENSSHKVTCL